MGQGAASPAAEARCDAVIGWTGVRGARWDARRLVPSIPLGRDQNNCRVNDLSTARYPVTEVAPPVQQNGSAWPAASPFRQAVHMLRVRRRSAYRYTPGDGPQRLASAA